MEMRIGKLEGELKSTRSQMFNNKKVMREDTDRASLEVDSMKGELESTTKRERETFSKMMIIEKELETLKDDHRVLKRENEKVKSDFEQTLKMCETYESKVTSFIRKDENIRAMVDHSK